MQTTSTQMTPEELVTALLHRVGTEVRLADDADLARLFDDAARRHRAVFGQFRSHPHYHFSERLTEALQALDQGGTIVRENAAQTYFRVSQHARGPYGESLYGRLADDAQAAIDELATEIRQHFGIHNDTGKQH